MMNKTELTAHKKTTTHTWRKIKQTNFYVCHTDPIHKFGLDSLRKKKKLYAEVSLSDGRKKNEISK